MSANRRPSPSENHRTTEIRTFERECNDPQSLAIIIDFFQDAFRVELEEIQALKEWAKSVSDETGTPIEVILGDAGRDYAGIIRKSNFLNGRRKELDEQLAKAHGKESSLLTMPLSENKDERIMQEPEYMVMLNDDLSDPSNYFSKDAKRLAKFNRDRLDQAQKSVRDAEALSTAIRRHRG